jgi:endo-1,4-beta-xylanase
VIHRRHLLAGGISTLAMPAAAQAISLRGLAAAKDVTFGTAAASYELKDRDFTAALVADAAQIVPEYEMKRDVLQPQPDRYDFSALDALFGFATRNGLSLRGHPLVWYYSNPAWLAERLQARPDERLLTSHIQTLMRRYPLASVDVVNEALAAPGEESRPDGLRPSLWLDAFGPTYIDMAFHAARAAAPASLRVYNDWGCEQGGAENDRFRARTLNLLDGLLKRGVPVDALGLQGHLSAFGNKVDQRKLAAFLGEIRARGLALLVTELDISDTGGPSDINARDRAVADEARRFLDVVLASSNTRAVLTWSLSDRYVDAPDDWKLKMTGWRFRKTPYDMQMRKKPLWTAIAQSFAARRVNY